MSTTKVYLPCLGIVTSKNSKLCGDRVYFDPADLSVHGLVKVHSTDTYEYLTMISLDDVKPMGYNGPGEVTPTNTNRFGRGRKKGSVKKNASMKKAVAHRRKAIETGAPKSAVTTKPAQLDFFESVLRVAEKSKDFNKLLDHSSFSLENITLEDLRHALKNSKMTMKVE